MAVLGDLRAGDRPYDGPRLAYLLKDLPVRVLARMRSDRVLRRAAPPHAPDTRATASTIPITAHISVIWAKPTGGIALPSTFSGTPALEETAAMAVVVSAAAMAASPPVRHSGTVRGEMAVVEGAAVWGRIGRARSWAEPRRRRGRGHRSTR
ncbi:hypothetical protein GCM10023195_76450 [Actinoallomurus liliacearum]|uniref:Uncharacterized protein n=1 Tax=Actinoallomurus liliacearum TaxID=1080073 RepID=A0ABP8TV17_9ACTN